MEYQKQNPDEVKHEIALFIETDDDVLSSKKIYACVGSEVKEKVLNATVGKQSLWNLIGSLINSDDQKIAEKLLIEGKIEYPVVITKLLRLLETVLATASAPAYALGWIIEKIGNGIDLLKFPTTLWDVNGEDYFFEQENFIGKLTISTQKIDELKSFLQKDSYFKKFIPNIIDDILEKVLNYLRSFVAEYNLWIKKLVENLYKQASLFPDLQNHVTRNFALLCGIWDGIIDTFSSIFIFVGQVGKTAYNAVVNIDEVLETIDNIFNFLTSGTVWNSVSIFFETTAKELSSIKSEDIDLVKIGYYTGFGIIFIAGLWIPLANITKIGKVGALGAKLGDMLTEIGSKISKVPKGMKSKTALQQVNRLLSIFKSEEKTRESAQQIAKEIKEWIIRNKRKIEKKLVLTPDFKAFFKIYTLTTTQHINYGHIRIKKINPKLPKNNPKRIIEEYKYTPKRGKQGGGKFNYQIIVGGMHNLNYLNKYVRLNGELKLLGKLPTGEKVYKGMVEFYISELKQWSKSKESTFFPKKWSKNKIQSVIKEASMNIILRDGNRYIGITKNGIQIEFRLNLDTREIETAFITFEKII